LNKIDENSRSTANFCIAPTRQLKAHSLISHQDDSWSKSSEYP